MMEERDNGLVKGFPPAFAPYVWIVNDLEKERVFVFYDGEKAHHFRSQLSDVTGRKVVITQQYLIDIKR